MKTFRQTSGAVSRAAFLLALVPFVAGIVELHADHDPLAAAHRATEFSESCAPGLPLHVEAAESKRSSCPVCILKLQNVGGEPDLVSFAAPESLSCSLGDTAPTPVCSAAPSERRPRGPPAS